MAILTITTTSAQDARIAPAVGDRLGLVTTDEPPVLRDATLAEVKAFIISEMVHTVLRYEQRIAAEAARDAVSEITPT